MFKRFFCAFLIVSVFIFSLGTLVCFAETSEVSTDGSSGEDGFTWYVTEDGELIVDGSGAMHDCTWGELPPWFECASDVQHVTITGDVTHIGNAAFADFVNVLDVQLPDSCSVTSIGRNAFDGCVSLTCITNTDSVSDIGDYAFHGCSDLELFDASSSDCNFGRYAFSGCTSLKTVRFKSIRYVDYGLFSSCESLISVDVENPVCSRIMDNAFSDCFSLERVSFDCGDSIGKSAFVNCRSLKSVSSDSVRYIGDFAFSGCSSLETFTTKTNVVKLGNYAFENCDSLVSVLFAGIIYSESGGSMYGGPGYYVFKDCPLLETVHFDRIPSIRDHLFVNCPNLKRVSVDTHLSFIAADGFTDCPNLQELVIPDTVTYLHKDAFNGMPNLTVITTRDASYTISYCMRHAIPCKESRQVFYGDVDFDGSVGVLDVLCLQRYLAGMELPFVRNEVDYIDIVGDVDADGNIDSVDVTYMRRYFAGMTVPDRVKSRLDGGQTEVLYSLYDLK